MYLDEIGYSELKDVVGSKYEELSKLVEERDGILDKLDLDEEWIVWISEGRSSGFVEDEKIICEVVNENSDDEVLKRLCNKIISLIS